MRTERLVVVSGQNPGRVYPIFDSLTVGRNPDSQILLDNIQVSRRHAFIEQTSDGTFLRDLGSGNGTYVGDQRIEQHRLAHGDLIQIGNVQFRFESLDSRSSVRFHNVPEDNVEASNASDVYETFLQAPPAVSQEQQRQIQSRLAAVYKANQIIASERDLHQLFKRVMDQIFSLVPAHNGVIMLKQEKSGELTTEYVKSNAGETVISSTIVNRAFMQGEAVITCNAADDSRFEAGRSIIAQNISSAMCAPLTFQDERLGVVYVDNRGATHAFKKTDLELLVALAGPAAIAIKNAQYVQKLERAYREYLLITANAIEMRDHYTVGHTWRVTNFALEIARLMGWTGDQLKLCEMGGVLHDVGKIAVDDAILRKPDRLTDEEFAKMRVHPERGARMMRDSEYLRPLIPYCLCHHERYDGKGYPHGLAGEEIPIEGRVIAVADAFDAMTSDRPYRKGLDPEVALAEITRGSGTQFDPAVVNALVQCYREGRITRIIQESLKGKMSTIVCPFCSTYVLIPEQAQVGDVFQCQVCQRHVRLQMQNETCFGELVPET